jgi:hypothetical protein
MKFALAILILPLCAQTDLPIPASPALGALASTPAVIQPASPREFALSLLSGSQQAVAMDIAPYWLAFGHLVDRRTYKANLMVRLLAGIEISVATQSAQPSKFAGAASMRIFDAGDPRLDETLAECLERAARRVLESSAPCRDETDCENENTRREALLKSGCRDEARARNWNRSSWALGASKEAQSGPALAWSSLAYGFEGIPGLENTSQFLLQFSRRGRQSMGGLELRVGGPDTHVSLEWTGSDGQSLYSLAAERRIGDNLWLELTAAGQSLKRLSLLTQFHWGLAKK